MDITVEGRAKGWSDGVLGGGGEDQNDGAAECWEFDFVLVVPLVQMLFFFKKAINLMV